MNLFRRKKPSAYENDLFLSLIEGLEGGFAIFAGIVIGLYLNGASRNMLIITALISIIVNAVNAATVRYSTEHYLDELDGREKRSPLRYYFVPALVEFVVYLGVSTLAVIPLLLTSSLTHGIVAMIIISLVILFVGGVMRGQRFRRHKWRDGLELALGGGIIIAIGSVAGWVISVVRV